MARTTKGQETPRVALAQIEDLMKTSGRRGDALRADGLSGLAAVKRVKLIQTRRERARVAMRHGEASDQVARLDRQLAVEHRFLVNTRAEADRVATPVLERDEGAWQVHGYLRSPDGLGRARYGVALVANIDGRKTLAETTTDKRGYFRISLALEGKSADGIGGSHGNDAVVDEKAAEAEEAGKAAKKSRRAEATSEGDEETARAKEAAESDRIAKRLAQALNAPAFLGIMVPGQTGPAVDERPLYPVAGSIAYRDLTVANPNDDGKTCQLRTRLLGNSGSRELHDLDNEKSGCQIGEIRPDQRFYFRNIEQAEKLRYDYCAYCFGKKRSKR